ncbi:hypothetical protein C8R45DRAFT_164360 [Mycena sanguinolenta]|nr:hypothetical protein C8R45DRAFT_164360 [Mycena sanguinolenta]
MSLRIGTVSRVMLIVIFIDFGQGVGSKADFLCGNLDMREPSKKGGRLAVVRMSRTDAPIDQKRENIDGPI